MAYHSTPCITNKHLKCMDLACACICHEANDVCTCGHYRHMHIGSRHQCRTDSCSKKVKGCKSFNLKERAKREVAV